MLKMKRKGFKSYTTSKMLWDYVLSSTTRVERVRARVATLPVEMRFATT